MVNVKFLLNSENIWHWFVYKDDVLVSSNVCASIEKAEELSLKFVRSTGKISDVSLNYKRADTKELSETTSINSNLLMGIKHEKYDKSLSYQQLWDIEKNSFYAN